MFEVMIGDLGKRAAQAESRNPHCFASGLEQSDRLGGVGERPGENERALGAIAAPAASQRDAARNRLIVGARHVDDRVVAHVDDLPPFSLVKSADQLGPRPDHELRVRGRLDVPVSRAAADRVARRVNLILELRGVARERGDEDAYQERS